LVDIELMKGFIIIDETALH